MWEWTKPYKWYSIIITLWGVVNEAWDDDSGRICLKVKFYSFNKVLIANSKKKRINRLSTFFIFSIFFISYFNQINY